MTDREQMAMGERSVFQEYNRVYRKAEWLMMDRLDPDVLDLDRFDERTVAELEQVMLRLHAVGEEMREGLGSGPLEIVAARVAGWREAVDGLVAEFEGITQVPTKSALKG